MEVAIATALMPPLCTAGYGLAHQNWEFLFGAFYLFSINCVFIAVSVVIVTGFLHMPQRNFVDRRVERRVKATLFVLVTATSVPSAYLAYRMVGHEVFRTNAQNFVQREFNFEHTSVVALSIDPEKHAPLLALSVRKALSASEHERLVRWFRVRVKDPGAQVFIALTPRARK